MPNKKSKSPMSKEHPGMTVAQHNAMKHLKDGSMVKKTKPAKRK